jgi:hypothetical protein
MASGLAVAIVLVGLYGAGMFVAHAQRAGGPAATPAPAPLPNLIKVRPDLFVIQNTTHPVTEIGQNGGNVVVYIADDGMILIDSKNERMHDDIIAKVRSVTDLPIKYMNGVSIRRRATSPA